MDDSQDPKDFIIEVLHMAEMTSLGVASAMEMYLYFYQKAGHNHCLTRQCKRQAVVAIETFLLVNPGQDFESLEAEIDMLAKSLYSSEWDATDAIDEVLAEARLELGIPQ